MENRPEHAGQPLHYTFLVPGMPKNLQNKFLPQLPELLLSLWCLPPDPTL